MVVALLAVSLAGCGKSEAPASDAWIGGTLKNQPEFRFPGAIYALKSQEDKSAQSGRSWFFENAQWKPKGWSLWIASNVYSDFRAPKNDLDYLRKGFGRAESAAERSKQDSIFIGGISKWLKDNNVAVEVNYLGYDNIPASLLQGNDVYKGYYLTWNNQPCEKAFRMCINNYFVSPASRYSGGKQLGFKEWLSPYLVFGTDTNAMAQKDVIKTMGGIDDEKSEFFDMWPTMVFLVNPEGAVTRAWLPQKNDLATVQRVEAAIVKDIAGPYKDVPISTVDISPTPPKIAYYGQHYIETGVNKVLDTFQEIMQSK